MSDTTTTTTRWDELTEAGRQAVARGDLATATASYRSALGEAEAAAPDSARVASSLASLAQVHYQAKEYADAQPLFRRAMELRERLLGPDHPNVAQTLNNLAAVHVALGTLDDAEPLLLRSLAITERHRGQTHPDVAVNLNNLAKLYFKRNEHAKAEPLLVRLLELEKAANPTHPKVATALTSLASSRLALQDLAGAEAYLRRAEDIVGSQNPGVAAIRAKLESVRSGRSTPSATAGAIDSSMLISGPVSGGDTPPRRPSGPLPMNPWLAESEPPSVIAAESGDYDATQPPATESTRIVPTGTQEPIAPPHRNTAPAPLPPLVVPPQVPREFGDAMARAASDGSAVTTPAPPIKEAPSARPSAASLDAAVAALSRFAPPPAEPPAPPVLTPATIAPPAPAARIDVEPTAPPLAAVQQSAPPAAVAPLVPPPLIAPPGAAPAQLVPPPLIPPPSAPLVKSPATVTAAPAFVPPAAYAPPAPSQPLGLDDGFAPMPPVPSPASFALPGPAAPGRPMRSNEGPRFAAPGAPSAAPVREAKSARMGERSDRTERAERAERAERVERTGAAARERAPRKPRLQHAGSHSSGGGVKFVLVALIAAAIGGGAWVAYARSEAQRAAAGAGDPGAAGAAAPTAAGATSRTPAGAPSPITGVPNGAPAGAAGQPPIDEITSSPVPMSRREPARPAPRPTVPRAVPLVQLPVVNAEQVTRGIDSVAKTVDATLRPAVAAPSFGKPASP